MDTKQGSFSRVEFTVGGLERANGRKGFEMAVNSGVNDAFKDFGYEIEV